MEPSVANLVGMLSLLRPAALKSLSESFPAAASILRPGTTLGEFPAVMKARLAVTIEGLTVLRPLIKSAQLSLYRWLSISSWLEFGGAVIAALGSGGAFAVLVGRISTGYTQASVLATVALVGSIITLIVKFLRRDVFGTENALQSDYFKLRDADWQSKMLLAQLRTLESATEDQLNTESNISLIREADTLAGVLYKTLKNRGIQIGA